MLKNNKQGQGGLIGFLVVVGVVILFIVIIVSAFSKDKPPTTQSPEPELKLQILNSGNCLNQKDPWGWKLFVKATCVLSVKNLEQTAVQLQPIFKCWQLRLPNNLSYPKAEKKAIVSGEVVEFKVKYDNDGREWSCEIDDLNAEPLPKSSD